MESRGIPSLLAPKKRSRRFFFFKIPKFISALRFGVGSPDRRLGVTLFHTTTPPTLIWQFCTYSGRWRNTENCQEMLQVPNTYKHVQESSLRKPNTLTFAQPPTKVAHCPLEYISRTTASSHPSVYSKMELVPRPYIPGE